MQMESAGRIWRVILDANVDWISEVSSPFSTNRLEQVVFKLGRVTAPEYAEWRNCKTHQLRAVFKLLQLVCIDQDENSYVCTMELLERTYPSKLNKVYDLRIWIKAQIRI